MSPPLISKAAARYTGAGGREHCSLCRHFSPRRGGRCARVLGDISPMGWCRLFSREMRGLVADASSFNGGGGPSLGLDFMMPGVLDPRITFTRASTATYFNSAGVMQTAAVNAPRWDYDPATLALRGLLIEEARTNVVLNSATLSTQSVTVTAQVYTLSFYGTGTITKSGTATGALVGTGVGQRVSQTFTPTAGSLTLTVTGSVTNAQLEAGAFATSYIPTTSAAVTRAADACSMAVGSWYDATKGTLSAEYAIEGVNPVTAQYASVVQFVGANVNTDSIHLEGVQIMSGGAYPIVTNGTRVAGASTGSAAYFVQPPAFPGVVQRGAVSWAQNVRMYAAHSAAVADNITGTSATLPAVVNLTVAGPFSYQGQMSLWARNVRYWSRQLSQAELLGVTAP